MRLFLVLFALASVAGLVASRHYPTVERIEVYGTRHHDAETVLALAGLAPGDPFLWVTSWRLRHLITDPWISSVRVVRRWPHTIAVSIVERQPLLADGQRAWAEDGTELPDTPPEVLGSLPQLTGWGPSRREEALELASILADLQPKVISYTPEGFDIQTDQVSFFTPSASALRQQWAAFQSQLGKRMAVYPWGVSKAHE